MKKILLYAFMVLLPKAYAQFGESRDMLTGLLDADATVDTLYYSNSGAGFSGAIKTAKSERKFYIDTDTYVNSFISVRDRAIVLERDISNDGDLFYLVYRYDKQLDNWVLSGRIEEKPNYDAHDKLIAPTILFSYEPEDTRTIDGKPVHHPRETMKKEKIRDFLDPGKELLSYEMAEYVYTFPVAQDNVGDYEKIAATLNYQRFGIWLSEKIIEKFPERAPAYLSAADCYYMMGNKSKARVNYKHYILLMKNNPKKIPKRASQRAK